MEFVDAFWMCRRRSRYLGKSLIWHYSPLHRNLVHVLPPEQWPVARSLEVFGGHFSTSIKLTCGMGFWMKTGDPGRKERRLTYVEDLLPSLAQLWYFMAMTSILERVQEMPWWWWRVGVRSTAIPWIHDDGEEWELGNTASSRGFRNWNDCLKLRSFEWLLSINYLARNCPR